jgi:hypothetical protein
LRPLRLVKQIFFPATIESWLRISELWSTADLEKVQEQTDLCSPCAPVWAYNLISLWISALGWHLP